ncbi:MAG: hypothetical protein ACUVQ9_13350 [Thermodesulfobacteriota bacterium]
MNKIKPEKGQRITADMTVLDIVNRYRNTESIFKKYDKQTGECICCQALFDSLRDVADRYKLNLDQLLLELEDAIGT